MGNRTKKNPIKQKKANLKANFLYNLKNNLLTL